MAMSKTTKWGIGIAAVAAVLVVLFFVGRAAAQTNGGELPSGPGPTGGAGA